jgi:Ca2+-binding RTX toxin-like protein
LIAGRSGVVTLAALLTVGGLIATSADAGRVTTQAVGLTLTSDRTKANVGELVTFRATIVDPPPASSAAAIVTINIAGLLERISAEQSRGFCCRYVTLTGDGIFGLGDAASAPGQWAELAAKVKTPAPTTVTAALYLGEGTPPVATAEITINPGPPTSPPPPSTPPPPTRPLGLVKTGSAGHDVLRGTSLPDRLNGAGGPDTLVGYAGDDVLTGGAGLDTITAGKGNDAVRLRDGERDVADCGPGNDTVAADAVDQLVACESVTRG